MGVATCDETASSEKSIGAGINQSFIVLHQTTVAVAILVGQPLIFLLNHNVKLIILGGSPRKMLSAS